MSELERWAGLAQVLAAGATAWVMLYIRAELAKIRLEMSEQRSAEAAARATDKLETRNWINGSFMRAALVEARLKDMADRLDRGSEHDR